VEILQPEALEELYRRFAPLVHARTRRIVGRDADDVVRALFVRLVESKPDDKKIASWIFTNSTELAIASLVERARRDTTWEGKLRAAARRRGEHEGQSPGRELSRLVLARLDSETQKVVVMVLFEELTHDEAAVALGLPRETVDEHMRRFHDQARTLMEKWRR
jgi:RNA polymerase sigma factor (sigma-70 family)